MALALIHDEVALAGRLTILCVRLTLDLALVTATRSHRSLPQTGGPRLTMLRLILG